MKEGTILYERRISLRKGVADEQVRAMMPEYNVAKFTLAFSDSVSIYKPLEEDNSDASSGFGGPGFGGGPGGGGRGGGGGFRMRQGGFGGGDNAVGAGGDVYRNYGEAKSIESHELGNHTYLIEDSIRKQKWKITPETKIIEGHPCRKAVSKIWQQPTPARKAPGDTAQVKPQLPKEVDVEAWYAEDMPSPAGPDVYGSLPGVVLILIIDNGSTYYVATAIVKDVKVKDIKAPKGRKTTRDDYNKMVQQVINNQNNGNNRTMIRSMNGGGF